MDEVGVSLVLCGHWISCPGKLIEVLSYINVLEYMNILETVLLPSVRRIYTEEDIPTFRLVQDNSAIHTARIVKE